MHYVRRLAAVALVPVSIVCLGARQSSAPGTPAAALERGDRRAEAAERRGLGVRLFNDARYVEARVEFERALELYEALDDHAGAGWTLHHLGSIAFHAETAASADRHWSRGLAAMERAADPRGQTQLLYDRTTIMRSGPEKAALLERLLARATEIGDARLEAELVCSLGEERLYAGDFAGAMETLQRALDQFERLRAEGSSARTLMLLGRLHVLHGRPERALPLYQRAIATLTRLGDKPGLAQGALAMANMHRASGQPRQAVAAARRALALRLELGAEWQINQMRVLLAWLHMDLREYRDARGLLEAVVAGTDQYTRDLAYDPLAQVHLALGEYEAARDAADRSARSTREPASRPFMLANRARAEDKLGLAREALQTMGEALRLVEDARDRLVPTDPMKQGFAERVQGLFAFAIDLRARHGQAEAALEAAEQARARAFLDLLATREREPSRPGAASPELRSTAGVAAFSVTQLAAAARRLSSTIVSYWAGPERTTIWIVGPDGLVHSTTVPIGREALARLVALTGENRASVAPAPVGAPAPFVRTMPSTRAWHDLFELLIAPVEAHLPAAPGALLTIVPHGPLSRLSFAGLRDGRGRYLVERYATHYVPAGAVLGETSVRRQPESPSAPATYLLVANPTQVPAPDGVSRLSPLPGASGEVDRIRRVLPAGSVVALAGPAAHEDQVRATVGRSRVVHFATHAVLRDDRSLESYLALGRAAGSAADGRLTAREIYDLSLEADFVVLSACRTAAGPVTGDGIVGLARAFFSAGASSVVATLWDLADESGQEMMPAFYRQWLDGQGKALALRAAQLELLTRLRSGRAIVHASGHRVLLEEDPFLWAGYIVLGQP